MTDRCRSCERFVGVDLVRPVNLAVLRCEACGRSYIDPVALAARKSAEPRTARMFFGAPPDWYMCPCCGATLLRPATGGEIQCSRCGERYECRPLVTKTATTIKEVFARIAERPDDDSLRELLADLFLEAGDARGEFIRLQLEQARSPGDSARHARIHALLDSAAWRWLPPGVELDRSVFHRGLLTQTNFPSVTDPAHDGWLTVTALDLGLRRNPPEMRVHSPLGGPLLQSLERITRCRTEFIPWLGVAPPPRLRSLGLVFSATEWSMLTPAAFVASLAPFLQLEALDLAVERPVQWHDRATALITAFAKTLKTLWLPLPPELPLSLRRAGLLKLAPQLTVKLASFTKEGGPRTTVTIAGGRVELSEAPRDDPAVVGCARRIEQSLRSP